MSVALTGTHPTGGLWAVDCIWVCNIWIWICILIFYILLELKLPTINTIMFISFIWVLTNQIDSCKNIWLKIELLLKRKLFLKEKTLERKIGISFLRLSFPLHGVKSLPLVLCPSVSAQAVGSRTPHCHQVTLAMTQTFQSNYVTVEKNVCVNQISVSTALASQFSMEKKWKKCPNISL